MWVGVFWLVTTSRVVIASTPVSRRKRISAKEVKGPRRFLRYPDQYGIADPADPAPLAATERHLSVAAQLQHEVARQVGEQIARLDTTEAEVAQTLGISTEQVQRYLRGESAMSIERMYQLARAVALDITFTIKRTE